MSSASSSKPTQAVPKNHHLDKRAVDIAAAAQGADDELLRTRAVALWLDVSTQFLEIGRLKGYGPPFIRISPHHVRYRRGDVLAWLKRRANQAITKKIA
jgi:predicted DNA-binding transcriptional regulator AlpA